MSRDDLIRLLTRAVTDGTITEAQAVDLLRQFDAGTLNLDTLPLLTSEMDSNATDEIVAAALIALALLLGRRAQRASVAAADIIQERFENQARILATRLDEGTLSIAEWQRAMNEEVLRNLTEQTLAATGAERLSLAQRQRIRELMRQQNAYLSRFADTIVVAGLVGAALSLGTIANRAESYAGYGRGLFFATSETEQGEDNLVYDYISRDDKSTCSNCLDAEANSPYLPGQGPMPGSVCKGRGRCRCSRVPRRDPQAAARLRAA